MLGFTHALAPVSPPPPAIFSPNAMAGQQQSALLPSLRMHFQTAAQSPQLAAVGPQYTAQAPAVNHPAAAAPQTQLAPIFQAQVNPASDDLARRDSEIGHWAGPWGSASNQGTKRGGAGVGKTCQACSVIDGKPVQLTVRLGPTRSPALLLPQCTKCVVKSKGVNRQLKVVDGVPHVCPYK